MKYESFLIKYEQNIEEKDFDENSDEEENGIDDQYNLDLISSSSGEIAKHIKDMTRISIELSYGSTKKDQLKIQSEQYKNDIQQHKNNLREYFLQSVVDHGYLLNHQFLYDVTDGIYQGLFDDETRSPLSGDREFYHSCLGFLGKREISGERNIKKEDVTQIITVFRSFLNDSRESSDFGDDTKLWYMQLFFSALFEYEVSESECKLIIKDPAKFEKIIQIANDKCNEEFEMVNEEEEEARKESEKIANEKANEARELFHSGTETKSVNENHQVVKMPREPLKEIQKIDDEKERKRLLAKIALVAGYSYEEIMNDENITPEDRQKIEAVATLMTVRTSDSEALSICTQSTNILLANGDAARLEGFLENCSKMKMYEEEKGAFADEITNELGPKLYAVSRNIVANHKQNFTEQHRSGQKLSLYKYSPQEIRQIQFCLSIYQGNSQRVSTTDNPYPNLPEIDGVMLNSQRLTPDQKLKLETNRFVYALEMNVEFNRFLFAQLNRVDNREDKKEIVIHFAEYYHQLRDYYVGDISKMPTQLCKDYFTTLVNHKINPLSKVSLIAPPDPFQKDSKETKSEVAISDYLLSIEGKMLTAVSEVKIAEYQIKMKSLERKLKELKSGKIAKLSQDQLKAYESMTTVIKTADDALSALTKKTGEYNERGNTFLGLRMLVSDKEVEDAFALAEKSVAGLSNADQQYREFAFMLKDAMYDMYVMQWDMLHRKRENHYKRNALNPTKEKNNPIQYTIESYNNDADDIALSVMLLGENKFGSSYINKSSAQPDNKQSIYITDPATGELEKNEILMQPEGMSMRKRISSMSDKNPRQKYVEAYGFRDPAKAFKEQGPINEYTRSMSEGLDTGGIGSLDLSMRSGYDAWFANQLGRDPSKSESMKFYPKLIMIGGKKFVINIYELQKQLKKETTLSRSEYFRDGNGQLESRASDGDIVRFNGNMDDFSVGKGDGKYEFLNRNNISDITGNSFDGIIEPKFEGGGKGGLGDFKVYRKVEYKGRSYYFSQCITDANIKKYSSWNFDKKAAEAYITGYEKGKELFNGKDPRGGKNGETGGYRALEVTPELKSRIEESQGRSLELVRNFPEVEQCARYANTIKEKFGPLRALVEGANSGKIPQSLYELFRANNGARIGEMKNNLKELREQFSNNGLVDDLIHYYREIVKEKKFGTYVDETEGQILAMLQQLESIQSQLQQGGQLNELFTRLETLSPNNFMYWLKTDGLVLIAVIAATIAAMALTGGIASGFTGVVLSGLISGTVGVVASETFTYGVHEMRSSLDLSGEKVNHSIIKTAAQQGKWQEAIWGWCNQILLTTAMSSGISVIGTYVINPIKASLSTQSSLSSTILSGVEQLSLNQTAPFIGFLRTILLKGTSRLVGWMPETIKKLGSDASRILGELGSEIYEEAIQEELIARLLGDNGTYLMQLLGYVKGRNPSIDPVEHFGMTYHGENANGEILIKYNGNSLQSLPGILRSEGTSDFTLVYDGSENRADPDYTGNFRVTIKGKDTNVGGAKSFTYYFEAVTSNIEQRKLASILNLPDGDIKTKNSELQISLEEPIDERKDNILNVLRKDHVIAKEVRGDFEVYHVVGTDAEYTLSFVGKTTEQVIVYDEQEIQLFGKDLLGIIRKDYAYSEKFPHGIRKDETIYSRMKRVVVEGKLRNEDFANYFPLLTRHLSSISAEQRILFATYILGRGSISEGGKGENNICGSEVEQAHQEKNLLSKAKILRDAGYDEFERLLLFKWHVCNSGDELTSSVYKEKYDEYMKKISVHVITPAFIQTCSDRCGISGRKSDADRNQFIEFMSNLTEIEGFHDVMMDIMSNGMVNYADMCIVLKGYNFKMGLNMFYEKLKLFYQVTGSTPYGDSGVNYARRRELLFHTTFKRSNRKPYVGEEETGQRHHDEVWFSELQQIASGADSKVYIHPQDPDHVYKVYNRNLNKDDLRQYYQIMEDFNKYLEEKRKGKYLQYRFATVNHQIIGSRVVGLGNELIVKLDRIEGDVPAKSSYDNMAEFDIMFTMFLTGKPGNGRYIETKDNFKKTNDGVVLATDVDRIAEVLYDYRFHKNLNGISELSSGPETMHRFVKNTERNIARREFLGLIPKDNPELIEYIQNCSDIERIEIAEFVLGRELSDLEVNIILAAHDKEPEDARPERSDYASGEEGDKEWKKACDGRQIRRLKAKRDIIDKPEKFGISGLGGNDLKGNREDIRHLFEWSVCGNPKKIGKPKVNADLLSSHHPSLVYTDPSKVTGGILESKRVVAINKVLDELGYVRTTSLRNLLDLFKKKEGAAGGLPNAWTIDSDHLDRLLLFKDEFAIFDRFDLVVFDNCNSPKELYQMMEDAEFAMLSRNRPTDAQLEIASHMFSRAKEQGVGHCPSADRYFHSSMQSKVGVLLSDGKLGAYTKNDGDQNTMFMNEHGERNGFGDLNDVGFTISRVILSEINSAHSETGDEIDNVGEFCSGLKNKLSNEWWYTIYVNDIVVNSKGFITLLLNEQGTKQVLGTKKILPLDVLAMSSSDYTIRSPSLYAGMKQNIQTQIGSPDTNLHFKDLNKANLSTYRESILAIANPQDCIDVLLKYESGLVTSPPQGSDEVLSFARELIKIKQLDSVETQSRHENYKKFLAILEPLRAKAGLQLDILSRDLIKAGFLGNSVLASQIKEFQNPNDTRGEYISIETLDVKKVMSDAGMPEQFQHMISNVEVAIKPLAKPDNHKQIELKLSGNGIAMVLKWKVNEVFTSSDVNSLFDSKFRIGSSNEMQWDYFKNESDYSSYGFIGSTYYQTLFTSLRRYGFKKLTGECMAGSIYNGYYTSLMLGLSENQGAREIIKNDLGRFITNNSISGDNLIQLEGLLGRYSSTDFDASNSLLHDLFAIEFNPAIEISSGTESHRISTGKELRKLPETKGGLGKSIRGEFAFDLETQEVEIQENGGKTVNEKKHREYFNDKANIATAEIVNLSDEDFDRYLYEFVVSGNETIGNTLDITFKMNAWKFGAEDFNALNDNPNAPVGLRYAVRLIKIIQNDAIRKKVAISMMNRFFPGLNPEEQQTLADLVIEVHNTLLEDGDRRLAKQLGLTELQKLNDRKYRKLMYSKELNAIFKKNEANGKRFARACMVFGLCGEKVAGTTSDAENNKRTWGNILEYKNKKNRQTYADYFAEGNPVIVHALQPAGKKLWQIKEHFDTMSKKDQLNEEEIDILADLGTLATRKSLSTSLISKDHVFTWGDFGIGIAGSGNNVIASDELDLGSVVNSNDPIVRKDRISNADPEVLLGDRRPMNGYNEVVLQNTDADKLSAQFLWYKTCGGKPQVSDYTLSQLQSAAKEKGLELVPIEQELTIHEKTECKFYNLRSDFSIDIEEGGVNYSARISTISRTSFTTRSHTTHQTYPMTLNELNKMRTKLGQYIEAETDSAKKDSMQQYYDNLKDDYQKSYIDYRTNPKYFTISIPSGNSGDLCMLEYHDGKMETYILRVGGHESFKREPLPIEKHYFSQIVDMVLEDGDPRKVDIKSYLGDPYIKEGLKTSTKSIPEGISFSPDQTPKVCQDIALDARKGNKKLADDPTLVPVINQIIDCTPEKRAEVAAYLLDGYTFPDNQSYHGDVQVNFTVNVNGQEMTYSSLGAAIDGIHMIYEDSSGNLDDEKVNAYKHKNLILLFNSLNNNNQNQSEEMSTILLKWNVCNGSVNRIVDLFLKSPEQCLNYLKSKSFEQNIIGIALRKLVHVIKNPSELLPHFLFTGTGGEKTFTQYQSDCLAAHIKLLDDNEAGRGISADTSPYKNIFKACPPSVYKFNEMLLKVNKKNSPSDTLFQRQQNELFRNINRSLDVHESGAQSLIPAELDKMTVFINDLSENVIKSKEFQNMIIDCLIAIKTQQPNLLNSPQFKSSFGGLTDAIKNRLTKLSTGKNNINQEVNQKYYELLRMIILVLEPNVTTVKINENIIESVYISSLLGRNAGFSINAVHNYSEIGSNDASINREVKVGEIVAFLQDRKSILDPIGQPKTQQMEHFDFLNNYSSLINSEIVRYFTDVDFETFQVNFCKLIFGGNRNLNELKLEFSKLDPIMMNKFTSTMRSLYDSCNPSGIGKRYDIDNKDILLDGDGFQTPIDLDLFDKHWKKVTGNHEGKFFGSIPVKDHLVYLYTKTRTEGVVNDRVIELSEDITNHLNTELSDHSSKIYLSHGYNVASFNLQFYPTCDLGDRVGIVNGSKFTGTDGFFVLSSLDSSGKVISKKVCLIDWKLPSGAGNDDGCGLTKTITLQKNNISYYPDGLSPSTINHRNDINEYEVTISTGSPKNKFIKDGLLGVANTSNQDELREFLTQKIIYTLL